MSGILDHKQRIFDVALTVEGRRQIASGKFVPKYVSFADDTAIYNSDTVSAEDAESGVIAHRFQLEAPTNLPQDVVTYEIDDSGQLQIPTQVINGLSYIVRDGKLYAVESAVSQLSGSLFFSQGSDICVSASISSFENLRIIRSPDIYNQSGSFVVEPNRVEFIMTPTKPINPQTEVSEISVDNAESIFFDRHLSHIPNFQYLPPINSNNGGDAIDTTSKLGVYPNLNQAPMETFEDVESEVRSLESSGFASVSRFIESSKQSNIVAQLFEVATDNTVTKLDVIDFGEYQKSNGTSTRVFFAGKVFEDSYGSQTFISLFTLLFEV